MLNETVRRRCAGRGFQERHKGDLGVTFQQCLLLNKKLTAQNKRNGLVHSATSVRYTEAWRHCLRMNWMGWVEEMVDGGEANGIAAVVDRGHLRETTRQSTRFVQPSEHVAQLIASFDDVSLLGSQDDTSAPEFQDKTFRKPRKTAGLNPELKTDSKSAEAVRATKAGLCGTTGTTKARVRTTEGGVNGTIGTTA